MIILRFNGESFSYTGQNYNPNPTSTQVHKTFTSHESMSTLMMKARLRKSHQKDSPIFPLHEKISTSRKGSPLSAGLLPLFS